MPCYHPISAFKTASGEVVFQELARYGNSTPIKIPCGQCIGCKLERSRQWGVRCMHEAQMHKQNCFITLTYNEEIAPEGTTTADGFVIEEEDDIRTSVAPDGA